MTREKWALTTPDPVPGHSLMFHGAFNYCLLCHYRHLSLQIDSIITTQAEIHSSVCPSPPQPISTPALPEWLILLQILARNSQGLIHHPALPLPGPGGRREEETSWWSSSHPLQEKAGDFILPPSSLTSTLFPSMLQNRYAQLTLTTYSLEASDARMKWDPLPGSFLSRYTGNQFVLIKYLLHGILKWRGGAT